MSPSKAKRWGIILVLAPLSLLLCVGWLVASLSLGDAIFTGGGPLSILAYLFAYLGVALIAAATMAVMFRVLVGGVDK